MSIFQQENKTQEETKYGSFMEKKKSTEIVPEEVETPD